MPRYDGVVTVADDEIPVIVELDDELIRLTAGGTEIGHWHPDECEITQVADSTYTIEAEDEVLRFVPSQPRLFAAALDGDSTASKPVDTPSTDTTEISEENTDAVMDEAPPPQPLTMGLFYGLCFLTAALAVWSLVSMIF